jgi:ribosomal protein S18 acetylase RimI-like enzyme
LRPARASDVPRIARLSPVHRDHLRAILTATDAFSADEISVAIELFDLATATSGATFDGSTIRGAEDALEEYEFVGAFDADTLLGFVCFGPTPSTDGTYDLYWLAVDPAAQGRGAGRAMADWVTMELASRGARLLLAETSSGTAYESARAFYARNGYAEVARVRDFYAPGDDRIMLTTRLTAQERGAATQ